MMLITIVQSSARFDTRGEFPPSHRPGQAKSLTNILCPMPHLACMATGAHAVFSSFNESTTATFAFARETQMNGTTTGEKTS
jgi:hypothetical protein